eukprot:TRINITY_DN8029_c3_g1_i1.p1 TRINITY_DN8029_c3_g1~~TRINITY_DN8029_c3_g1_i1.p1  ORF type:complete len:693 (+),score=203.84 TRINITY_DN8029_c3_g1_i1:154-2232(+)
MHRGVGATACLLVALAYIGVSSLGMGMGGMDYVHLAATGDGPAGEKGAPPPDDWAGEYTAHHGQGSTAAGRGATNARDHDTSEQGGSDDSDSLEEDDPLTLQRANLTQLLLERSSASTWDGAPWFISSLRYQQRSDEAVLHAYALAAKENPFDVLHDALTSKDPKALASLRPCIEPFYTRAESLRFDEPPEGGVSGVSSPSQKYASTLRYNFTTYVTHGIIKKTSPEHPACQARGVIIGNPATRRIFPGLSKLSCRRYPFGMTKGVDWRAGEYNVLKNIVFYNGDLYSTDGETKVFEWGGHFTALRGLVFQPVEHHAHIVPLPAGVPISEERRVKLGFYQPPVDYHTMWHVIAETVMPMFHSLLPFLVRGERNFTIFQPPPSPKRPYTRLNRLTRRTLRQTRTSHVSCLLSGKKCLETKLGEMVSKVFAQGNFNMEAEKKFAIPVDRMLVGHPTNCMPLWQADGLITASIGGLSAECANMLWLWRAFLLREYRVPFLPALPSPLTPATSYVVWASRRGGWARDIVNEEEIILKIQELGCKVNRTQFSFSFREQFMLLQKATHFVAPHGASLVHTAMLRPHVVAISVDVTYPGFGALVMEVPWLHHFHYKGFLVCNKKHPKNRRGCRVFLRSRKKSKKNDAKVSEHNNNIRLLATSFMQLFNSTFLPLQKLKERLYSNSTHPGHPPGGRLFDA